jgi:hypothetical protein
MQICCPALPQRLGRELINQSAFWRTSALVRITDPSRTSRDVRKVPKPDLHQTAHDLAERSKPLQAELYGAVTFIMTASFSRGPGHLAKKRLTTLRRLHARGHGKTNQPMIAYASLDQPKGTTVTGMTKPRFRFLLVALWISLVGALLVWFTFINAPSGGSPPWVVSLIVSWLPFLVLVGVWLWYSRTSRRSSSGTSWVDLYEQQVAESRRTNALLERIAAALEKPSPG